MAKMTGEPCDLSAALERSLRERVPEAMKRPALQRRPHARNLRRGHRRVEVASEENRRRKEPVVTRPREDQTFDRLVAVIAPSREQLDDIRDQVNVTSLPFLGVPTVPPV